VVWSGGTTSPSLRLSHLTSHSVASEMYVATIVQSLSELLCCYICADRLRDASLCPHCSKMGCYTCIQVLGVGFKSLNMLNVLLFRMCSQHKEKVSVYCETCHLCICHDCVLWETSPHKGHSYVKLEVLLKYSSWEPDKQCSPLSDLMTSSPSPSLSAAQVAGADEGSPQPGAVCGEEDGGYQGKQDKGGQS
jgi:hypothetical protein